MKTILVDAVNTLVIEGEGINERMHDLLEKYPNNKIVLTNANDEEVELFKIEELPYEFFTLKHEPNKTEPEYYKRMLSYYDLKPGDVVYFEHNSGAVESARSVGIATYHYDPVKKDMKALKKFLDENVK